MMFLSQNWYFSVQKALIYYTLNKSHHNSFILLVFSHVANFRYVANFTFLTLPLPRRYYFHDCFLSGLRKYYLDLPEKTLGDGYWPNLDSIKFLE